MIDVIREVVVDDVVGRAVVEVDPHAPEPAGDDVVIMVPFAKLDAAQFGYAQTSSRYAVVGRHLFHLDDPVGETEHVRIVADLAVARLVVQQEHGALILGELLLEVQELSPVP